MLDCFNFQDPVRKAGEAAVQGGALQFAGPRRGCSRQVGSCLKNATRVQAWACCITGIACTFLHLLYTCFGFQNWPAARICNGQKLDAKECSCTILGSVPAESGNCGVEPKASWGGSGLGEKVVKEVNGRSGMELQFYIRH